MLKCSLCIPRAPVFCLPPAATPGPGPQFVFNGPGPQFVFNGPGLQFVFTDAGPKFLFTSTGLSGAWACIYQPCPPKLYLLALAYDLYYRALNLHLTFYL